MFHTCKMSGGRWKQVQAAFTQIGHEAMQYDADGIEICFINSTVRREFVKVGDYFVFPCIGPYKHNWQSQDDILNVYNQVQPGGARFHIFAHSQFDCSLFPIGVTPTGAKLDAVLTRIIDKLEDAVDTPAYGLIKPMDIIVLTDGVPTDDPATVLQAAARKLDEGLHHPNAVGIQFVQIGNEEGADVALQDLCNGPVRVSSMLFRFLI